MRYSIELTVTTLALRSVLRRFMLFSPLTVQLLLLYHH